MNRLFILILGLAILEIFGGIAQAVVTESDKPSEVLQEQILTLEKQRLQRSMERLKHTAIVAKQMLESKMQPSLIKFHQIEVAATSRGWTDFLLNAVLLGLVGLLIYMLVRREMNT
jgi:hypothetical protein